MGNLKKNFGNLVGKKEQEQEQKNPDDFITVDFKEKEESSDETLVDELVWDPEDDLFDDDLLTPEDEVNNAETWELSKEEIEEALKKMKKKNQTKN